VGRISRSTIDRIFDAVRIEEVIGDYVQLKRSGSSFKGLSPFNNERTPSFYVVPSKQIFKDFSSGKGGSVVNFLMELEHLSYPEVLRLLAKRYNIEIEEEEGTPEEEQTASLRESLFLVNEFARDFYVDRLWHTDEGRSVGLGYFKERGFEPETLRTFELGISPDTPDGLTREALSKAYKEEFLLATGLTRKSEDGRLTDLFRSRVIFPIHGLSGRVLGFGGRILKTQTKAPKYVNSPESELYHKSKVLYGLYQARKALVQNDRCLLVEGYTDVLSLHQAGIQNVVASAGTALTTEQIRLVKRLTPNLTILYDGDPAGIRASLRGIDLALSEGLRVKVVLLPDGHDPDSFARSKSREEILAFIEGAQTDFVAFKARLLLDDTGGDPIKKIEAASELVRSVALLPQPLERDVYLKEVAKLTGIEERLLQAELAQALGRMEREKARDAQRDQEREKRQTEQTPAGAEGAEAQASVPGLSVVPEPSPEAVLAHSPDRVLERELLRLLLNEGHRKIAVEIEQFTEELTAQTEEVEVVRYLIEEVDLNEIEIGDPGIRALFERIRTAFVEGKEIAGAEDFLGADDTEMAALAAELMFEPYRLSDWERKAIYVRPVDLAQLCKDLILRMIKRKVLSELEKLNEELQKPQEEPQRQELLRLHIHLNNNVRRDIEAKLNASL